MHARAEKFEAVIGVGVELYAGLLCAASFAGAHGRIGGARRGERCVRGRVSRLILGFATAASGRGEAPARAARCVKRGRPESRGARRLERGDRAAGELYSPREEK